MTRTPVTPNGQPPEDPTVEARWGSSGRTFLYHFRRKMGAHITTDVIFTERRYIYPVWQRVWKGLMLASSFVIVWLLGHIAHDLNLLLARGIR